MTKANWITAAALLAAASTLAARPASAAQPASTSPAKPPATAATTRPIAKIYVDPARGDDRARGDRPEAPLRTLPGARRALRALDRATVGDVVISLAPGEYVLDAPLALGLEDGGVDGHRVIWQGPPGPPANPGGGAVISGGVRLTGWTLHDADRGIWKALPPGGRSLASRQLFVDGRRALRAYGEVTSADYKVEGEGYLSDDARLLAFRAPGRAEFVYRAIWTNPRCGVASVTSRPDGRVAVRMRQPGFDNGRKKGITSINKPWRIENAYELLDQPGEWYLDEDDAVGGGRSAVYYKPYRWEDMSKVDAVVPVLEHLVTLEGPSADRSVKDVTFRDLEFRHTTWLLPSTGRGLPDAQNCVLREQRTGEGETLPDNAALRTRFARGVAIERSRFTRLGGIGVLMLEGTQRSEVRGCTFVDLAGTGIQAGDYAFHLDPASRGAALPADKAMRVSELRIADNFIDRCGVEYRSSTAIGLAFPADCVVEHNEVRNMPYSGIHVGWGWDRIARTATGGNRIEANSIRNVMLELADGGAIYTLGPSDGPERTNLIRGNFATRIRWGQAWYLDEGSNHYEVVDNVAADISDHVFKLNSKAPESRVRGLYADKDRNMVRAGVTPAELAPTLRTDQDPAAAARAEAIRLAAGLRPEWAAARVRVRDAVIYEAEEADLSGGATGAVSWKPGRSQGWLGMAYVEGLARARAAVAFDVSPSAGAGEYELRVRYQAPDGDAGELALSAGDAPPVTLAFPSTGAERWGEAVTRVRLASGTGVIRLARASASERALLLDRMELVPAR